MDDRFVEHTCAGSVHDVLARLLVQLEERGIKVFAVIDHAAAAREAGLALPDEIVAIFGNPTLGTTFMQYDARAGIDLPLRILIWDDDGSTKAAYTSPSDIVERFALDPSHVPVDKLSGLLEDLAVSISR
ncbi:MULTISPECIES: DUF302 domain-containing protein [unclassified Microbacterium]|uniref:DUF302 domain-containing protein n=1 Tax=unclassified Microbacterium TaxID=2609290 RepID=UPI00214C3875|nr:MULTISPECIES: DUF302 domain-containing protein [unclassified Microbacterium]MCR2810610.1 DUF302 domain-containing protein [Microbacterium sp. zg.B185]WIM18147.1 DUF302 domain-containing protein [Microbacterium sp. zg-B185]